MLFNIITNDSTSEEFYKNYIIPSRQEIAFIREKLDDMKTEMKRLENAYIKAREHHNGLVEQYEQKKELERTNNEK